MTKAARFRLIGILLLAGVVGVTGWFALKGRKQSTPESLLAYISSRVAEGDGDAFYRMMLPHARRLHEGFVAELRSKPDAAVAVKFREALGLSRADVETLEPRELLRRETEAFQSMFAGARLVEVKPVAEDEAVMQVLLRDGPEKHWHLRRVDGVWRIHDHVVLLGVDGQIIEKPRTVLDMGKKKGQ